MAASASGINFRLRQILIVFGFAGLRLRFLEKPGVVQTQKFLNEAWRLAVEFLSYGSKCQWNNGSDVS